MIEIREYEVTLAHDAGRITIKIVADDIVSAITRVCHSECAPTRAVRSVELVRVQEVK